MQVCKAASHHRSASLQMSWQSATFGLRGDCGIHQTINHTNVEIPFPPESGVRSGSLALWAPQPHPAPNTLCINHNNRSILLHQPPPPIQPPCTARCKFQSRLCSCPKPRPPYGWQTHLELRPCQRHKSHLDTDPKPCKPDPLPWLYPTTLNP